MHEKVRCHARAGWKWMGIVKDDVDGVDGEDGQMDGHPKKIPVQTAQKIERFMSLLCGVLKHPL